MDRAKGMGANETLGLPRDKMKRVVIAIDVDGTLRCNCTDTCEDPNKRIVALAKTLATFKNVKIYVWSGGGKAYAQRFMDKFGMPPKVKAASKLDTSTWVYGRPQIAIDDIQDTAIGDINLIVNEKKPPITKREE